MIHFHVVLDENNSKIIESTPSKSISFKIISLQIKTLNANYTENIYCIYFKVFYFKLLMIYLICSLTGKF
jgi:hypothetical protein